MTLIMLHDLKFHLLFYFPTTMYICASFLGRIQYLWKDGESNLNFQISSVGRARMLKKVLSQGAYENC